MSSSDVFIQPDTKRSAFNTDPPLDKALLPDPKKAAFEDDLVFDDWGYYPFLYESERTVQLGGLTINQFGFGSFGPFPPLNFPSFDLIAGSDPAVAIPDAEEAPVSGTEAAWCFQADGSLVEVPEDDETVRTRMCQAVLQPCAFANFYVAQVEAMSDAGTMIDADRLQSEINAGGHDGSYNQSPSLGNFITCDGTKYEFIVVATVKDDPVGFSTFQTIVTIKRDGVQIFSQSNVGISCGNAAGRPNSCTTVVATSLASVWKAALAFFKTDFEANSGCDNCVITVAP